MLTGDSCMCRAHYIEAQRHCNDHTYIPKWKPSAHSVEIFYPLKVRKGSRSFSHIRNEVLALEPRPSSHRFYLTASRGKKITAVVARGIVL